MFSGHQIRSRVRQGTVLLPLLLLALLKGDSGPGLGELPAGCRHYSQWTSSEQFFPYGPPEHYAPVPIVALQCKVDAQTWMYLEGPEFSFDYDKGIFLRSYTLIANMTFYNLPQACDQMGVYRVRGLAYFSPFLFGFGNEEEFDSSAGTYVLNVKPGQNAGSVQPGVPFAFWDSGMEPKRIPNLEVYFPTWFLGPDPYVTETDGNGGLVIRCVNTPWLQEGMPIFAETEKGNVDTVCRANGRTGSRFTVELSSGGGSCSLERE